MARRDVSMKHVCLRRAWYRLVKLVAGLTNFLAQGIMGLNSAEECYRSFSSEGGSGSSLGVNLS